MLSSGEIKGVSMKCMIDETKYCHWYKECSFGKTKCPIYTNHWNKRSQIMKELKQYEYSQIDDDRFEIIESVKAHLLDATNIKKDSAEWEQLDTILFRLWQLGYLKMWPKYKKQIQNNKA